MLNNEKRLLQRIQEGEIELFTQIADHYSRAIFTLVVRIVGSAEEAEELTQDIFLKAGLTRTERLLPPPPPLPIT